jgi:hypothetical protein
MSLLLNDQTVAQAAGVIAREQLIDDGFINIAPSDEAFAVIAARFADQIITDVRKARKVDDAILLIEVIKVVALLGRNGRGDLLRSLIAGIDA